MPCRTCSRRRSRRSGRTARLPNVSSKYTSPVAAQNTAPGRCRRPAPRSPRRSGPPPGPAPGRRGRRRAAATASGQNSLRSSTRNRPISPSPYPNGAFPARACSSMLLNSLGTSGSGSSSSSAHRASPSRNPTWKAPTRSKAEPWPPALNWSMPTGSRTRIMAMRPGAHVGVRERHARCLAAHGPGDPRAGEAVGLLLGRDRRQARVRGRRLASLHDVAVLVGQHDAEDRWPELGGEVGEDAVRPVVVDQEVALLAVEGAVLVDLLVRRRAGRATARDRVVALGIGGVDTARSGA